ncbi:unnamed protein product [Cochlearia groenlandica]
MPIFSCCTKSIFCSSPGSSRGDSTPRSPFSPLTVYDRQKVPADSTKSPRHLANSSSSNPSSPGGHKFHEAFQMKQGRFDLQAAKISELMKSNNLDNAPTQSLLSIVNGILDDTIERKNGEIPQRVACLLRKVIQEIERRISTQSEHLRTQNTVFKSREEKYHSRIKVLETLASGTSEENEIATKQLRRIKTEKSRLEEKKKNKEEDVVKLEKENCQYNTEVSTLRRELETTKKAYEQQCLQMESQAKVAAAGINDRVKELEQMIQWKNKAKEMEEKSELKNQSWSQKELSYRKFINFQFQALQELRFYSKSIKQEILEVQDNYAEEFSQLGKKLLELGDAAENYHAVLTENQKLFNELQELKGNIRVYCRVRPFLPGQGESNTVVEHIGEYGELVVLNPTKPGKDGCRKFRFNKVYSPASTQAEVFLDIKPLVRSVLDGYNVCIFAYGQTGSGKTYTMTGPDGASEEEWGVNYRALNDLFKISQSRKSNIAYEVGVQMVEIYNEQVRDLLSDDSSQKKYPFSALLWISTIQQNGLAVPDASMYPVTSTSDVLELMSIGLENRTVSSTALNERSSRSHSIVTVHVRGKDLKTGSTLFGNLHLVDLAGSERIDRSEVTGDRLKEAQHINKSLSALGDVIFSLASKNSHVPYRNSKLTQLLQSSLGGRAKTLMFVQLNPDVTSYSESMSTLKFAERVSGVELGAAKSSKDGRDVRELMEQLGSLKDTIARKDDEIERLHLLKDINHPQRLRGKSLGQSEDFNSEAGDSQLSIEEDTSFQQDYLRQSPHSVTDSETVASSNDAEYDERLDETEGSIDVARKAEGRKPLKISVKTKPVTPRGTTTTRPLDKLKQVATRTTTIGKLTSGLASPSMKKTGSASNLLKSSKRWA